MPAHPKLTDDQRQAIIDLKAAEPDITQPQIIDRLGLDVSHITISRILNPAPSKAPAKAVPAPGGAATPATIPHARLIPCPLNPRKTFDPDALQQLADSLRAFGGAPLQNLVVRPCQENDGFYEILAGERRWRAAALNIAAGHAPFGLPMPCKVVDADDEAALEIALVENDQREDVAPMEQAAGYAALRDLRRAKDPALTERQFILDLAGRIGRSDTYVRQRLHWADRLCDAAKDALATGAITKDVARVLVLADDDLQAEALAQIADGGIFDADDLREFITQDMPPLAWAIFDGDDYDGEIVQDPDDPENGWFKDVAQAMRLQREAIDALKDRLAAENEWVEVIGMNDYFRSHLYREHMADDGDEAPRGAVIDIAHGLGVTIHEGLARKSSHPEYVAKPAGDFAPNQNNPAAPTADPSDDNGDANAVRTSEDGGGDQNNAAGQTTGPHAGVVALPSAAPCTKAHLAHARRRKSMALQNALRGDVHAAMALTCLALMGHQSCCRIQSGDIPREDSALYHDVAGVLEDFRQTLAPKEPGTGAAFTPPREDDRTPLMLQNRGWGQNTADSPGAADLLRRLLALPKADLHSLFAHLVARQSGSFVSAGPEDPGHGDFTTVRALADHLGLTGNEQEHGLDLQPGDLEGLRQNAMDATALAVGIQPGTTAKGTRQKVASIIGGDRAQKRAVVLPTLRFGDPHAVMAAMTLFATGEDPRDEEGNDDA